MGRKGELLAGGGGMTGCWVRGGFLAALVPVSAAGCAAPSRRATP